MEIKIKLDEEKIREMVEKQIAEAITSQYGKMANDKKIGLRSGIEKAVKSYIYDHKDEVVERCVKRASTELVRRGLPKLLDMCALDYLEKEENNE